MLAVLGIIVCIIAGIISFKNGSISADTFYLVMSMFVTGLLVSQGEKKS